MSKKSEHARSTIYLNSTGDLLDSTGLSNPNKAITNNLYGFNYSNAPLPLLPSRNLQGHVFFTRPQLNMNTDNLFKDRRFIPLLTSNEKSIPRWIRNTLDPRLAIRTVNSDKAISKTFDMESKVVTCPLVDNKNAFIPLLTNSIQTVGGWPDKVTGKFTSEPNRMGDVYQQVDSGPNLREPLELDFTATNTVGDPLFHLLDYWSDYAQAVFSGELDPYFDMIVQNEKDYETRVFRIVLDATGNYVERIAATRPGFIEGISHGQYYDMDKSSPYISGAESLSFRFTFPGAEYRDPILVYDFNNTVITFNPDMADDLREKKYRLVDRSSALMLANHRIYYRINPYDLSWEYWAPKSITVPGENA